MTKNDCKQAYETLNTIHTQFIDSYDKAFAGNRKEKEARLRKAQSVIDKTIHYIQTKPDIFNLIAKGTDFEKQLSLDDFTDIRYFDGTFVKLLRIIQAKIDADN